MRSVLSALRSLDWTDLWSALAVALLVAAILIWADYVGNIVVVTR